VREHRTGLGHHLPETGDSRDHIQSHQHHAGRPAVSGPGWGLPPYLEDDEPDDQVKRLRRFEAAYPEVEIERPDYTAGQTWYHASYEGRCVASDKELRGLLDQLDRLFPQADQ
jgi:hypothetical protein